MKRIFFVFLLGLTIACRSQIPVANGNIANNRIDTIDNAVLDSILSLNMTSYIGKPVDSLLASLPLSEHSLKIFDGGLPFHAERLRVNYGDKYLVHIIVRNFLVMNKFDTNRIWDINLFRQEQISWIAVYYKETCISGCNTAHSSD